jgi:hypothetical protein
MNAIRLLGACVAAAGLAWLGGCVAVPAGTYYDGSVVYSQPYYGYPYYYPYSYPYYGYWGPSVFIGAGYYGGYYHGGYHGHWPYWGHGAVVAPHGGFRPGFGRRV